jgi:hypothetical protein
MKITLEKITLTKNEEKIYVLLSDGRTQSEVTKALGFSSPYICQVAKKLVSANLLISTSDKDHSKKYFKSKNEVPIEVSEDGFTPKHKSPGSKTRKRKIKSRSRCRFCKIEIARGRKYCSKKCRGLHQVGPRSSQWKGGKTFEPYCWKFNKEFKERVRAFFKYRCFLCGSPQDDSVSLSVHHVLYNKLACCDGTGRSLFVPLCEHCHNVTSPKTKRPFWIKVIGNQLMERTGGKCYFTKDEMKNFFSTQSETPDHNL